jgi:MFS family permease
MFGVVWASAIGGGQMKSYARMLGFNDFAFGVMSAMPFLATFGQIPATIFIERTGYRKSLFLYVTTISRMLWLVVALIPWICPIPSTTAVVLVLTTLCASWFLSALGGPAWFSWMGDLIPRRIRGRYMAHRNRLAGMVQIVAVIAFGFILDAATRSDVPETALQQPQLLIASSVLFVLAAVFGTLDIVLFYRIREVLPSTPKEPRRPVIDIHVPESAPGIMGPVLYPFRYMKEIVRQIFVESLSDRVFSRYVLYASVMTFGASMGGWYIILNAMENLGFNKLGVNILFMVLGPLAGILGSKPWGKMIDRWGRRPTLMLATGGTVFSLTSWFFATRYMAEPQWLAAGADWVNQSLTQLIGHNVSIVGENTSMGAYLLGALAASLGGFFWTGVGLAQGNIMLGFSDGPGRSKYVAAAAVLISIGGVLGGLAGGALTESLNYLKDYPLGPFQWNNWHVAMFASMLGRFSALLLLIRMPDPGSGRVRDLVRFMSANVFNAVNPRLFYRSRIFGIWSRDDDEDGKP